MTISTVSSIKKLGLSLAAGALLFSASPVNPDARTAAAGRTTGVTQTADIFSPDTLHHWPDVAVADLDPTTLHHWPTATVADFDPDTLHHWGSTVTVADVGPFTLHHWA